MATISCTWGNYKNYNGGWTEWKAIGNGGGYTGSQYDYIGQLTTGSFTNTATDVKLRISFIRSASMAASGTFTLYVYTSDPSITSSSPISSGSASWSYYDQYVHALDITMDNPQNYKSNTTYYVQITHTDTIQVGYGGYTGTSYWDGTITYTPYTVCGAPTAVSITRNGGGSIITQDDTVYISWSGASAGVSNSIQSYYIECKEGNSVVGTKSVKSTNTSGNTTVSMKGRTRGSNITATVQTRGSAGSNYYSGAKTSSNSVKVNTLPNEPTGSGKTVSYGSTSTTLSITAGNTNDSGQSGSVYYSSSASGTKTAFSSGSTKLSLSTGENKYYFWTYDGLEYSSNYLTITIKRDTKIPTISAASLSYTEFTPYHNDTLYKYITQFKLADITASFGDYSSASSYTFYYKQNDDANSVSSSSWTRATDVSINSNISVSSYISAGNYFKVGISVTSNLGDISEIFEIAQVLACGKALTASDFYPSISVNSKINNNGNIITTGSTGDDWFNNYVQISWTNSSVSAPRFSISNIELGYIDSSGNFSSCDNTSSISKNLSEGASNSSKNMLFSTAPGRGSTITPAIRVTPVGGESFIVSSGTTRSRTYSLGFPSNLSLNPTSIIFFDSSGAINTDTIYFTGGLLTGDTQFLDSNNAIIKITNNLLSSKTYDMNYTISGNEGKIDFSDSVLSAMKNDLKGLGKDEVVSAIYTLRLEDIYGNVVSKTFTQTIDFRVSPILSGSISVNVLLADSSASTSVTSLDIISRILNPEEKIILSWNAADDPGNGNTNTIQYEVKCYKKSGETTSLSVSDGALQFTEVISNTSYTYTVPYGNETVDSIYFTIRAKDQTGLYSSTTLSFSDSQKVAVGRAMAPKFEITSYSISDSGYLTGTLIISDFGDSRAINPEWKNYNRGSTGLVLAEGSNRVENITTNNSNFTIAGYSTSGKITLTFKLYYTYLPNDIYSEKIYIFSFSGPTFSYRNHQIGINASADARSDTAFIVAGEGNRKIICFISTNPDGDDMTIDTSTNRMLNFIIDGGTWD